MAGLIVDDVMTRHPRTMSSAATILAAYEAMSSGNFRHLPVLDGKRSIGIVSDRDILRHMPPLSHEPRDRAAHGQFLQRPIAEIMTQNPLTVLEGSPLEVVVELMLVNQVSAVLVEDQAATLRGIVTTVDVASALLRLLRGEISQR